MYIKKLKIQNVRNLGSVELEPNPRLNILYGSNGAGKTSVLESIVVLSRGRSFRTNQSGELTGPAAKSFFIFAETRDKSDKVRRLGLERSGKHWRARKDGQDLAQLSQLTRELPLVLMEPNSHLLVSGTPEVRRKFLDWGMFHVEQEFLEAWRRFSKILKQRNAALRFRQESVLDSIDEVFVETGLKLGALRKEHCLAIAQKVQHLLGELSAGLDTIDISYSEGWSKGSLEQALHDGRERDLLQGKSNSGPHRADVALIHNGSLARATLSRGEQKILSAALLLAQLEILTEQGDTPIVLLDDLASEFDQDHYDRVLRTALKYGSQVWITGTRKQDIPLEHKMFHVEHGGVQEMV